MNRHRILIAILSVVTVLSTACGKPAAEAELIPAPVTEGATIRYAYRGSGTDMTLSAQLDAFRERFPQHNLERVPFGLEDDPQQLIEDGLVDVIIPVNVRFSTELLSSGLLLDLEPFIRNSDLDAESLGHLLEATRYEGRQGALPYRLLVDGLNFDQASLNRLGIARPNAPATWNQFRETLKAIAKEEDGQTVPGFRYGTANEGIITQYLESKAGGPLRSISERDLREALQFFQTLIFEDKTMAVSPPRDFTHPESVHWDLSAVKLPLSTAGANNIADFPVFPFPAYSRNAKPVVLTNVIMIGIAANSPVPDAAWDLVRFLIGEESVAIAVRHGGVPLYRTDAIMQAWEQRRGRSAETDRLIDSVFWAVSMLTDEEILLHQHTYNAANRVFSGAMTVDESIAQWRLDIASLGQ